MEWAECKETQNGPRSCGKPRHTHQKLLVEVPRLTRRIHDAVVTTELARQFGGLPTEAHPSLDLLAASTSHGILSMLSPQLLAPREAGITMMDPFMGS